MEPNAPQSPDTHDNASSDALPFHDAPPHADITRLNVMKTLLLQQHAEHREHTLWSQEQEILAKQYGVSVRTPTDDELQKAPNLEYVLEVPGTMHILSQSLDASGTLQENIKEAQQKIGVDIITSKPGGGIETLPALEPVSHRFGIDANTREMYVEEHERKDGILIGMLSADGTCDMVDIVDPAKEQHVFMKA